MGRSAISLHNSFAPDSFTQLFDMAVHAGCDAVEPNLPRGESAGADPTAWPDQAELEAGVDALVAEQQRTGLSVPSVYGGGFWVVRDEDQPHRARGDIEFLGRALPLLAKKLGTRVLTVNPAGALIGVGAAYVEHNRNGSAIAQTRHYERAGAALRQLAVAAESCDMRVAVETHAVNLVDCAAAALKVLERADHARVGICWDVGNLLHVDRAEPWPKQFEMLKGRIFSVHLKTRRWGRQGWHRAALESGVIEDFDEQIGTLCASGFSGPLVIEAPGKILMPASRLAAEDAGFIARCLERSAGAGQGGGQPSQR